MLPYGACAAAEAAAAAGHETRLLDLMFERDPAGAVARACAAFRPGAVGFSLRNIDNNDRAAPEVYYREAAELAAAVRLACTAPVVLGGAAMAIMPEALLRHTGADWGVRGDAGTAFPGLLAALAAGRSPLGAAGVLAAAPGGGLSGAAPEFREPAVRGLFPRFSRWVDLRAYRRLGAVAPLKTKLGCPFGCVYCTYSLGEGAGYRLCRPEEVAEAALALARDGVRDIELVDSVFNSPYSHALDVCAALRRAAPRARLHTGQLNPAFTDGKLLGAMRAAGFASIGVTAESADDGALAGLGKNYRRADLERAAAAVRAAGLPCLWVFLLGGPGETRAGVRRTLDFARRSVGPRDAAFFGVGVRVYPGTPLEAAARREGSLSVPPEEMLEPVFYRPPGLDLDWVRRELGAAMLERPEFIGPGALGSPLVPALTRAAGLLGMRPPLWRHTGILRRALRAIGAEL